MSEVSSTFNDDFRRRIEDLTVEGWEVAEEHDNYVVMKKRKTGTATAHIIIALLTAWWTFGIGNVLYWAYKHFIDADKKVVRPDDISTEQIP